MQFNQYLAIFASKKTKTTILLIIILDNMFLKLYILSQQTISEYLSSIPLVLSRLPKHPTMRPRIPTSRKNLKNLASARQQTQGL